MSSAEAYVRRSKETIKVEGPSEVRVVLSMRIVAGGMAVASTLSLKRVLLSIPGLKAKRRKLDDTFKLKIIEAAEKHGVNHAVSLARNTPGYEKVNRCQLKRWKRALTRPKKKMGRPTASDAFNTAVLNQLMFASVDKDSLDESRVSIVANVAYSYDIIRLAAQEVRKLDAFKDDVKLKSYKFSNSWIRTWVKNMKMRRRRVTTTTKVLPPPAEVQERMLLIQERLLDFEPDEIISGDETGFNYGALPLLQYVPQDAERATAPDSDEKARITAMLWGYAAGKMGAIFVIMKCSSKAADLSKTRVLNDLHQLEGFRMSDGWEMRKWTKELEIKAKGNEMVRRTFTCPYLIDAQLNVVTIQHKAWMDTARVCMWIDVQLGPFYAMKRGRAALVWDNCGPHGTAACSAMAEEWGIELMPLPPNMTDVLQVMDLVVNAPVKAAVRRDRCKYLYDFFQAWKVRRLKAQLDKTPLPAFAPPKPKVVDGLRTLFNIGKTTFVADGFQTSLAKAFVDCCISPVDVTDTHWEFKIYKDHKHGSMNKHDFFQSPETDPELGNLGVIVEAIDATTIETRQDAEDAALSDDEDGDESDSEEGGD